MTKSNLTKTCSSCGMQKPLSAFLQIAGPEGTTYGNICATCRKESKDKATATKDIDEGTRSSTEHTIDSKSKVQAEIDKRELKHRVDEEYYEEREKESEQEIRHVQKDQKKSKEEKQRRESFLEKRPYTVDQSKSQTPLKNSPGEIANREKRTDLISPFIDTQIAGKLKYDSSIFKQFKKWLGNVPMTQEGQTPASVKEKMRKAAPPGSAGATPAGAKSEKKAAGVAGQSLIAGKEPKPEEKKASTEYIEKTWGPNSRRR